MTAPGNLSQGRYEIDISLTAASYPGCGPDLLPLRLR